jgi:hypothetical protein
VEIVRDGLDVLNEVLGPCERERVVHCGGGGMAVVRVRGAVCGVRRGVVWRAWSSGRPRAQMGWMVAESKRCLVYGFDCKEFFRRREVQVTAEWAEKWAAVSDATW